MSIGPNGVDPVSPMEIRCRRGRLQSRRARPETPASGTREPDAIVQISPRAENLSRWLSARSIDQSHWTGELAVNEIKPDRAGGEVDSRRTAEAIMKKVVPELYAALADAGEVEE